MKIYIGFSYPKKPSVFAAFIRFVECRPYDHVYIRIKEPNTNEWVIFQASGLATNLISAHNFSLKTNIIKEYEIEITQQQFDLLWRFVVTNLGVPYSLLEAFGILLMKIFKLKRQPFNRGLSAQICSELGAYVCFMLDVNIPMDISEVDPSALDSILEKANFHCNNAPDINFNNEN